MTLKMRGLMAALIGLTLTGINCSQVYPAGSLGYLMHGDTQLRPTPTNFLHVPPRVQDTAPTPMQWGLDF